METGLADVQAEPKAQSSLSLPRKPNSPKEKQDQYQKSLQTPIVIRPATLKSEGQ